MDGKEAALTFLANQINQRQARPIKYRVDLIGLRDRIRILVSSSLLGIRFNATRNDECYSADRPGLMCHGGEQMGR